MHNDAKAILRLKKNQQIGEPVEPFNESELIFSALIAFEVVDNESRKRVAIQKSLRLFLARDSEHAFEKAREFILHWKSSQNVLDVEKNSIRPIRLIEIYDCAIDRLQHGEEIYSCLHYEGNELWGANLNSSSLRVNPPYPNSDYDMPDILPVSPEWDAEPDTLQECSDCEYS